MMASAQPQRSAPFSTHSRGVPLFNRNRFFDIPRHVARLLLDLRDISSSAFWFLTCQTWLTLWTALITLCSGRPFEIAHLVLEALPGPPAYGDSPLA